jgi:hypothetical protein
LADGACGFYTGINDAESDSAPIAEQSNNLHQQNKKMTLIRLHSQPTPGSSLPEASIRIAGLDRCAVNGFSKPEFRIYSSAGTNVPAGLATDIEVQGWNDERVAT